jgi:exodeoxyribonuclease VII large subunit
MPELLQERKVFSLHEVASSIRKTISERYTSGFWVKAEMNKLNYYAHSGHCYPELVEKKEGKIIAQFRAVLWKEDYRKANNLFLDLLKEPLKDGIKLLFFAQLSFDPMYGVSLRMMEIDPYFTLGDLELEKRNTLLTLEKEGLRLKNKSLTFPFLPKRIAILSVETSKGLADFMQVLQHNPFGYQFQTHLFPSLLQGDKAVPSMLRQLERIEKVKHHFDVVAIIRGGGGDIGLTCYNHLDLARKIACFPLPILTGIGHATNETVAEMIAYSNAITPTKMAEMLIQSFHNVAVPIQRASVQLSKMTRQIVAQSQLQLRTETKLFKTHTQKLLGQQKAQLLNLQNNYHHSAKLFHQKEQYRLNSLSESLKRGALHCLKTAHENNEKLESHVYLLHPDRVLQRGYAIVSYENKAIQSVEGLQKGDAVQIKLFKGSIAAQIIETNNENGQ